MATSSANITNIVADILLGERNDKESYREELKKIMEKSLIPERYKENEDFMVFIDLLKHVAGEVNYFKDNVADQINPSECDGRFIRYLAGNMGYNVPEELMTEEEARLIVKHYLSLLRRRGSLDSLINAVRFSGRTEKSFLESEEGMDVSLKEYPTEGLIDIDTANLSFDALRRNLEEVRPAGVKWVYAIRFTVPLIDGTPKKTIGFGVSLDGDPVIIDLNNIYYTTSGVEDNFNREPNLNLEINSVSNNINEFSLFKNYDLDYQYSSGVDNEFNRGDIIVFHNNFSSGVLNEFTRNVNYDLSIITESNSVEDSSDIYLYSLDTSSQSSVGNQFSMSGLENLNISGESDVEGESSNEDSLSLNVQRDDSIATYHNPLYGNSQYGIYRHGG